MHMNLEDLWTDMIRSLYDAETQLKTLLPVMREAGRDGELREHLLSREDQNKQRLDRLREVMKKASIEPSASPADATMRALLGQISDFTIEGNMEASVRDAALLSGLRRIEHYQMAAYEDACNLAHHLKHSAISRQLRESQLEAEYGAKRIRELSDGGWFTRGIYSPD